MNTLPERLREEMSRSVAGVRPGPDPYGRLLRRHRRRAWRWGGAGIGAVLVAVLFGAQALTATGGPSPRPAPSADSVVPPPEAELTPWTRRIIEAPVRGDAAKADPGLAGAVEAAMDQAREHWHVPARLDRTKALFVVDLDGVRLFGAVYYNDERALYVGAYGPLDTPLQKLAEGRYGSQVGAFGALTVMGRPEYTIAMAPPGCAAEGATSSTVRADGTLEHAWTGGGDFVVSGAGPLLWRVTCDGVLREISYPRMTMGTKKGETPPTERGVAEPEMVREVLFDCPELPGLDVGSWRVLWGGTPPGETRPTVVALGLLGGGAVQVCAVTGRGDSHLVTNVHAEERPDVRGFPPAALTTAVSAADALVAVRLPEDGKLGLAGRLLVIAPPGATELHVTGAPDPRVTLTGGVGVIVAPVPATLNITAVDASGRPLTTTQVAEPRDADQFIAGQPLLRNWD